MRAPIDTETKMLLIMTPWLKSKVSKLNEETPATRMMQRKKTTSAIAPSQNTARAVLPQTPDNPK